MDVRVETPLRGFSCSCRSPFTDEGAFGHGVVSGSDDTKKIIHMYVYSFQYCMA